MPDNKKHHYVPRFYLRRFSANEKSISIYNVPSKKLIKAGPLKSQCYKDYFYGADLKFEKTLGNIEGVASEILKRLTTQPYSAGDHRSLVLYMAIQYGRTAYTVDALNEITRELAKHLGEAGLKQMDATLEDVENSEKNTPQLSVRMAVSNHYLLLDLQMKVIHLKEISFITSDTPVVFYNQLFATGRMVSNEGTVSKGLLIIFPVDSQTLIILYDSDVYAVGSRSNSTITEITASDIEQLNGLQIASAYDNVYFEDPSFPVAALLAKYNQYRRRRKSTFSVHLDKEDANGRSELLAARKEDLRTRLQLSFLRTTKHARGWRAEFEKQKSQPVLKMRDARLVEAHRQYFDGVSKGLVPPGEFPNYCRYTLGYFPTVPNRDFRH